jgi:hypothetical protein
MSAHHTVDEDLVPAIATAIDDESSLIITTRGGHVMSARPVRPHRSWAQALFPVSRLWGYHPPKPSLGLH